MGDAGPSWFDTPDGLAEDWRERNLRKLRAYEDRAVKRVCVTMGYDHRLLLDEAQARFDERRLRFDLLRELTEFEMQLGVGKLVHLYRLEVGDLFRGFHRTPVVRAFLELADDFDTGAAMGMVFNWPAVDAFMCIHTSTLTPPPPPRVKGKRPPDVRVTARIPWQRGKRLRVALEPLDAVLRSLHS